MSDETSPGRRSGRGSGWAAALVATLSGLALLGASSAAWSVAEVERDVGGVVVPEQIGTTGAEIEPALLVVGLLVLVAAVALAVMRGAARRVVAVVLVAAGVLAAAAAARGAVAAADLPGRPQPVLGVAVLAALGVVAAGILGVRAGGSTRLPARYDAPAQPGGPGAAGNATRGDPREEARAGAVDEWQLAAQDDDDA